MGIWESMGGFVHRLRGMMKLRGQEEQQGGIRT